MITIKNSIFKSQKILKHEKNSDFNDVYYRYAIN